MPRPAETRSLRRATLATPRPPSFLPAQTSAAELLGEVNINLGSLRGDRVSDRWYPLQYSPGSKHRPSGSVRLRVLKTTDVRSVSLTAAQRILSRARADTTIILKRIRARIADISSSGILGNQLAEQRSLGLLLDDGAPSAAAAAGAPTASEACLPALQAAAAVQALHASHADGAHEGVAGIGVKRDVDAEMRRLRAAAAASGCRVVGLQLEVAVVEASGLTVPSCVDEEADAAEVYATLRAGCVTR